MRAFFCLPLGPDLRALIARAADRLRRETRMSASWVEPENYHVTLRFLGEIDPLATADLRGVAARAAEECGRFSLALRDIGAFPSLDRARVLWVGGETPQGFMTLIRSLNRDLSLLGFPEEPKPAVAHTTIARLKGAPDPRLRQVVVGIGGLPPRECSPDRILLMQSELTPRGAQYTPLFSAPIPAQTGA